ncbi:MAG: thioredoxin-dependent thiol peroxidase [Capsulimonadaceae bacterium]
MSDITVGVPAPDFRLTATTREGDREIALSDYAGKSSIVLYFYPKDDTPGCTTEACAFRDQLKDFEAAGSAILGISPDHADSHAGFVTKFALPFPLLADIDHKIADLYGVWKEKKNYGKSYWGIERTTFVIDKDGNIAKVFPRVKVDQHAAKVLEYVRTMS